MRIAVLSDIHGNIDALREVLLSAESKNIERLLILGDIVGYYYYPHEVLNLLNEWEYEFVRGNHEDILAKIIAGSVDIKMLTDKYGSAHFKAVEQLSEGQLKFLLEAPEKIILNIDNISIMMCHGSPWDKDYYLYPDTPHHILERCNLPGIDYIFVGHSHYAFKHQLNETVLVNVGSVGQSRKKGGEAQWVILDTENKKVEFISTTYNIEKLIGAIKLYDPNNVYLLNILRRQ